MSKSHIFRVKKDARYFVASNEPFLDDRLSWEARGVMAYLLTRPNDWVVQNTDLLKRGPAGQKKMDRILGELKAAGYMRRFRTRPKGESGFVWITEIYESPSLNPDNRIPPKQGDRPIPPFQSDTFCMDTKRGDIPKTESANTESANTETTYMHAVVDFFKFINEPMRSEILSIEHVTSEYAAAWGDWYEAGDFPGWMANPVGWAIRSIQAGNWPPDPEPDSESVHETYPQPGAPPPGLEGARWTGRSWA